MSPSLFSPMTIEDAVSSVLLCAVVLLVLVGNTLVVAAVATTRKLRTVTNVFIVNLACADLLLGVLILPFSAVFEILNTWIFGHIWCQIWLAVDVWLCTASIINLCCISLDRYLAITRPVRYPGLMSAKRAKTLVAGVWLFSFIVCCPPLIGWNDMKETNEKVALVEGSNHSGNWSAISTSHHFQDGFVNTTSQCTESPANLVSMERPSVACSPSSKTSVPLTTCELTNSRGYRIYAALGSFWIPMLVMVFFYLQIYRAAVRTISAYEKGVLRTKYNAGENANGDKANCVTLRVHRGGCRNASSLHSTQSTIHKSRSSDASLVTLADLAPSDSQLQRDRLRSPSPIKVEGQKGCFRWMNGKKERGSLKQIHDPQTNVRKHNSSLKNGRQHTRAVSVDSDDSIHSEGKTRLKNVELQQSTTFNSSTFTASSAPSDFNETTLSRTSSTSDGRLKKNRLSSQKPANPMKLHMQKFNREKKAAKTLAIIVGAFICCWMPFFTIYLVGAFCDNCISSMVFSVAFWLGYCNSAMNPCVYALFSRDFRSAFRRLLMCRAWPQRHQHFRPQASDVPAIQLHCAPLDDARSSSDIEGNNWR